MNKQIMKLFHDIKQERNTMSIVLTPAYGRKYDSEAAARTDWEDGRDFKIFGGPYTSIRDNEQLKKDFLAVFVEWNFPHTIDYFRT